MKIAISSESKIHSTSSRLCSRELADLVLSAVAFHHHGVRHGRLHAELVALAIVGRIGLVLYAVATDGNEKVMHAAARVART